jgi:hypothetical protein
MKKNTLKSDRIDKIIRNVKVPCIGCGDLMMFRIENETVLEGEGRIVFNIPGAVCQDCIDSVLDKVADPPGLVCINELSPILAGDIIMSFDFLLPPSQAVDFFRSMFPDNGLVYAAAAQRLHLEGHNKDA